MVGIFGGLILLYTSPSASVVMLFKRTIDGGLRAIYHLQSQTASWQRYFSLNFF